MNYISPAVKRTCDAAAARRPRRESSEILSGDKSVLRIYYEGK